MGVIKGDFLGFTFNGIHSSELGIFRVSDGSRYSENLLPTIQDKTTARPGADGTYYYGSFYTQRTFNLSIAYDELTDEQLRRLKSVFSNKKPCDLIFDETPYKVYKVKITGTPNLKYVCFNKPSPEKRESLINENIQIVEKLYEPGAKNIDDRIYKGEGQINFIAYEPFARSRYKYLDEYVFDNVPEWGSMNSAAANDVYYNFYEWAPSSRMITSRMKKRMGSGSYRVDEVTTNGVMYYNAGDIETPFLLYFFGKMDINNPNILQDFEGCTIGYANENQIVISGFKWFSGDSGIRINSRLHLVEGVDKDGNPTGTIYNKYIKGGDFFKFPPTEELTWLPIFWENGGASISDKKIEYKYIYY